MKNRLILTTINKLWPVNNLHDLSPYVLFERHRQTWSISSKIGQFNKN